MTRILTRATVLAPIGLVLFVGEALARSSWS